jgi:poly(A) polymerase
MREIWEMQLRLEKPRGKKAVELVESRRFRAAYDFLLLREQAGEDCGGLGAWWTELQTLDREARFAMAAAADGDGGRSRSGGRRRRARG